MADGARMLHENKATKASAFDQKRCHEVCHFQKEILFEDALFSVASFSFKHHG